MSAADGPMLPPTVSPEPPHSPPPPPAAEPVLAREMRGVHAGAIVLVGILAMNAGNYAYHLVAGRSLGPDDYGEIVALLTLAGLIGLPLGGAQMAIARYVAQLSAEGRPREITALARLGLGAAAVLALTIAVTLIVLTPLLDRALSIDSGVAVALTGVLMIPSLTMPVAIGVAQGLQRFGVLSAALTLGAIVRVSSVVIAVALGLGVAGVMGASVLGTTASLVLPLLLLRPLFAGATAHIDPLRAEIRRFLVPVVTGLLALTSLTTVDVLVAKAALGDTDAGIYGAASLIGRVILYLPATIATVLLPKVAARTTRGDTTTGIVGASIGVTAAFCVLVTAAYALVPGLVVRAAYGSAYLDASPLLWLFGTAMTLYAVINVLLFYHLGRGRYGFSWLLAAAAVGELAAFAVIHGSAYQLVGVSIAGGVAVLVAHEILIERTLLGAAARALRLTR